MARHDDEPGEVGGPTISRRHAIIGAGLGLGLLAGPGRAAGQPSPRPWHQDVDAGGHALRDLGGLNLTLDGDALVGGLLGSNLALDGDGRLGVADDLAVSSVATGALTGPLTGGAWLDTLAGDNLAIEGGRLNAASSEAHWQQSGGLLEPADAAVDGVEVERVESPAGEDLRVTADGDLDLTISGGGTLSIRTGGGHQIVLEDTAGAERLTVEDSGGNRLEMDAATGEVSISAASKLSLDAPTIDIAAGVDLSLEGGISVDVDGGAVTNVRGGLVRLNGGALPAARKTDAVQTPGSGAPGTIITGSPTVFIG